MLGVLVAEWLKRSHKRKNDIREAVIALVIKVPYVLTGMTDTGQEMDTSLGSSWVRDRETVMGLLITLMNTPTRFQWKGKVIRNQATELNARLTAAQMDYEFHGRKMSLTEMVDISSVDLFQTVFGSKPGLAPLVSGYRKTGPERSSPVPVKRKWHERRIRVKITVV